MPLRLAALFAVLAVAPLACAQDKKATPAKAAEDDRQAQLNQMIQDFVKARKEASAAIRAAQTDQERKEAEAKLPKEADFLIGLGGADGGARLLAGLDEVLDH